MIRADGWIDGRMDGLVYGGVGGVFLSDRGHFNENAERNDARGKVIGFPGA